MGKGDKRRPRSRYCTEDQFSDNWDNIFSAENRKPEDNKSKLMDEEDFIEHLQSRNDL